jgi:hypothetical protein
MIAVNEQPGLTITGVSRDWELDLTEQLGARTGAGDF